MGALTVSDLTVVDGGARITCRRLAEVLGYEKVGNLHRLIARHEEELSDFGEVFLRTEKNPAGKGRPTITYLLNEHHASALCLWAETTKARQARRLILDVFIAWQRGELLAQPSANNAITISKDEYIALLRQENEALRVPAPPARKPRKASVPLTDAERATILALVREGVGVNEIARRTGRSNACISLLRAGFRVIEGGAA